MSGAPQILRGDQEERPRLEVYLNVPAPMKYRDQALWVADILYIRLHRKETQATAGGPKELVSLKGAQSTAPRHVLAPEKESRCSCSAMIVFR